VHRGNVGPASPTGGTRCVLDAYSPFLCLLGPSSSDPMFLLLTSLALTLHFNLLVSPVASQHCQLNQARGHPAQQPLGPSVPSPSISPITNFTSSTVPPSSTSLTKPQPSRTPFVYGRDKIRGVNLCVVRFPVFPCTYDLPIPLEVAGSC
jgi:hypothetical protein